MLILAGRLLSLVWWGPVENALPIDGVDKPIGESETFA